MVAVVAMTDRVEDRFSPGELWVFGARLEQAAGTQAGWAAQEPADHAEGLLKDQGHRALDARQFFDIVLKAQLSLGPDDPEDAHASVGVLGEPATEQPLRRVAQHQRPPPPVRQPPPNEVVVNRDVLKPRAALGSCEQLHVQIGQSTRALPRLRALGDPAKLESLDLLRAGLNGLVAHPQREPVAHDLHGLVGHLNVEDQQLDTRVPDDKSGRLGRPESVRRDVEHGLDRASRKRVPCDAAVVFDAQHQDPALRVRQRRDLFGDIVTHRAPVSRPTGGAGALKQRLPLEVGALRAVEVGGDVESQGETSAGIVAEARRDAKGLGARGAPPCVGRRGGLSHRGLRRTR